MRPENELIESIRLINKEELEKERRKKGLLTIWDIFSFYGKFFLGICLYGNLETKKKDLFNIICSSKYFTYFIKNRKKS